MWRSNRLVQWLAVVVVSASVLTACGSDAANTATAAPSTALVDIGQGLRGPEGLIATTYATGLENMSAFAFDPQGRLWVATAAFEDEGTDAVYMVAGAGTAPVEVIGDIHTPLGLLWDGDVLYVSSAETVEAFADFDGATFASRTTIVSFPAGVGEVNGLTMSSDGRLVLGISAPCDACAPTSELSGAVVSFRPDGSDLRVEASSIRAPIGLAYYPGTDDLFVTMNHQDELGAATPGDWLALVESGQDWGFPDCYGQGGEVCNGVPEPVAELDQHAAVSGITFVTGQLGDAVGDAALVAEWTTGKVMRVTLSSDGSTYSSAVASFVTGLQNPVPVITTPDGAVLIGDWGAGTIYRIST